MVFLFKYGPYYAGHTNLNLHSHKEPSPWLKKILKLRPPESTRMKGFL